MVHLPAALGSYRFLVLYLLLCKTPTPCKSWINNHVFALHRFLTHSAQKVVQAHQKPVFSRGTEAFWWKWESPLLQGELGLRKLYQHPNAQQQYIAIAVPENTLRKYGYCHAGNSSGAASPPYVQAVTTGQPPDHPMLSWIKTHCSPQTELLWKIIWIGFFVKTLIIHFDAMYKPAQMSFKGWTLKLAGGKYPHYVLRFPVFLD